MMSGSFLVILLTFGLAGLVSFGVLWLIGRGVPALTSGGGRPDGGRPGVSSFLFRDELLIDHDAGALPESENAMPEWQELQDWLSPRFSGLPARLDDLPDGGVSAFRPVAPGAQARLELRRNDRTTRIVLTDPPHPCPAERHALLRARNRLEEIGNAFQAAPYPIWKTCLDGAILWKNAAAGDLHALAEATVNGGLPDADATITRRIPVHVAGAEQPRWYEVQSSATHNAIMHHATDITKIIRAETAQREFVQTLTKTFAYLTIGLAVFDRKRQLALFNPALVDLTSLSAEFLSARPELIGFFDKLRDRQVMPEPRSYSTWRTQINQVVASAQDGLYQETWSLPNDVTYRVTGRPHPDGAVAFLFEDISAEILLTRRHRTQLDLRQSAIDALPEAVMVIGPTNVLSFCNLAATQMLGVDPDSCFADMSIGDLMRACDSALPAAGLWDRVESALQARAPGEPLILQNATDGKTQMTIRLSALPGGARMLTLRTIAAAIPAKPRQMAALP